MHPNIVKISHVTRPDVSFSYSYANVSIHREGFLELYSDATAFIPNIYINWKRKVKNMIEKTSMMDTEGTIDKPIPWRSRRNGKGEMS
jgi:hypothetical protein